MMYYKTQGIFLLRVILKSANEDISKIKNNHVFLITN